MNSQLKLALIHHEPSEGANKFRDPAFMKNKKLPVHRWVPWIAGYSADFVRDIINAYVKPGQAARVLDPFCGVGTTLTEAAFMGYEAIGFEINPYPALASKVKLATACIPPAALAGVIESLQADARTWAFRDAPIEFIPPGFRSKIPFFSPRVQHQVLHLLSFIASIEDPLIADCVRVAFGATMISFSNYTYEPSLGSRPAAGKSLVEDAGVAGIITAKLQEMALDVAAAHGSEFVKSTPQGTVIHDTFFNYSQYLGSGSIDLIITSPPYLNNYHYVRNTRPHLHWLNFISDSKEQQPLETHNFGQYWQNVRDKAEIHLCFIHAALSDQLEQIRALNHQKGIYGGPGWANYAAAYFNDCYRMMQGFSMLMAPGSTAAVVVGNSIIQGVNLEVQQIIGDIAGLTGLHLEQIQCLREKRVGSSITQSGLRNHQGNRAALAEYVVIMRKP
ncbi:MAG: DNA methyltransferase [Bacteroidia bacterium]|nr:DNA methyltransferase [Bacteroidia bacterium]